MPTKDELKMMQNMTLYGKVMMTKVRIREWARHWGEENVCISFSGGKDSTVLMRIVREEFPNMPAVFVNTGLEYPEIQEFAKSFDNVTVAYPNISFKDVIVKYGYPILSKVISHNICVARRNPNGRVMKNLFNEDKKGVYAMHKWLPVTKADFLVSGKCCDVIKKAPFNKKGKCPFVATLACESKNRRDNWMKYGCNMFDANHPKSNPMSFWTENDVLQYIYENDIKICSVYGDISVQGGQLALDNSDCKFCTTGCQRTGCIFCGYGCHLEKGETRFQRLKRTHPKQYDFCICGGSYDPKDGLWKPDKNGLGMAHVFDELNKLYGENFIRYK